MLVVSLVPVGDVSCSFLSFIGRSRLSPLFSYDFCSSVLLLLFFLARLEPPWFWWCGVATLLEEGYSEWALSPGFAMLFRIAFVPCSFFSYNWPSDLRELSKQVMGKFA